MPRMITFDPDAIDEIDRIYLIDLLNDGLQCDAITSGLQEVAFNVASSQADLRGCPVTIVFDAADKIYPQHGGETTWRQHNAKRDEHLRGFGFLRDIAE